MWYDLKRDILEVFAEAQRCGGESGWLYAYHRINRVGLNGKIGRPAGPVPRCLKCKNHVIGGHRSKKNRAWWYCAAHIDPRKRGASTEKR